MRRQMSRKPDSKAQSIDSTSSASTISPCTSSQARKRATPRAKAGECTYPHTHLEVDGARQADLHWRLPIAGVHGHCLVADRHAHALLRRAVGGSDVHLHGSGMPNTRLVSFWPKQVPLVN